jgi:hypothetical protein
VLLLCLLAWALHPFRLSTIIRPSPKISPPPLFSYQITLPYNQHQDRFSSFVWRNLNCCSFPTLPTYLSTYVYCTYRYRPSVSFTSGPRQKHIELADNSSPPLLPLLLLLSFNPQGTRPFDKIDDTVYILPLRQTSQQDPVTSQASPTDRHTYCTLSNNTT